MRACLSSNPAHSFVNDGSGRNIYIYIYAIKKKKKNGEETVEREESKKKDNSKRHTRITRTEDE